MHQTGKTVDDTNRMKFQTQEFYLKSEDEMKGLFPGCEEAFENTVRIAERCNLEFTFHEYHLPSYPVPEGYTDEEYFRKLCAEGFAERYPDAPEAYRERLEYEIGVISRMGYVNYYLIVWGFHSLRQGHGHSRRAGAWVRCGVHRGLLYAHHRSGPHEVQPHFRAVPEPGTGKYAGFRYGFLSGAPGRGH